MLEGNTGCNIEQLLSFVVSTRKVHLINKNIKISEQLFDFQHLKAISIITDTDSSALTPSVWLPILQPWRQR